MQVPNFKPSWHLKKLLTAPNDQRIRVLLENLAGISKPKANAASYISPNDMRLEQRIELCICIFPHSARDLG